MFHPEFLDVIEHVSEWINIVFFLPALFIAFVPSGADGLSLGLKVLPEVQNNT